MVRKEVYLYGIAPCTAGLAFGYDTGSMSGILAMPQFLTYFNHPSNFQQGGITASILAGAFAGSLLTGAFLADRLGRRRTILLGSAIFTIGIAISTGANSVAALVAGRVINGLGNGCLTMTTTMYQSEIAPREIRGRIISVFQCCVNFGILIAFWIQYGTSHIQSEASWRTAMGLQMIAEMAEIVAKITFEKSHPPPSYYDLLLGTHKRRMWLGIGVQFWQSMTGINVIMYYAVFLFQQAGLSQTSSSLLANGLQGVVLNLFTYPNMYYMDTWGRRWPMVIGGVGMGISMMVIGVLMKTTGNPVYDQLTQKTNFHFTSPAASHTVIAFVYIYVAVFAITWACVAWVYPPEIFSMSMRGRATSMTTATNWFVNFWFGLYIPTAMKEISWKLYMIFMSLCFLMSIVIFLFYPESAGKTLEEMDFLFTKGRSIWTFLDREATKIGALFERDLAHGEAITVFNEDDMALKAKVGKPVDGSDSAIETGFVEVVAGAN
ncbi:high affinity glucose transporter [Penicillium lagena]|uniref:high affinity glucose transporter n=1 Tax=Penicillium lagena TaxID=94218 RepID=UPI002540FD38|nr:high affinity glucose transporter [Penicillium lagena]KAJ5606292.1 high affinity glucose transporter [Penicillium lagena]